MSELDPPGHSLIARRLPVVLMAAALGLALSGGAGAQLRDPPPGWDLWDPGWTAPEELWDPQPADPSLRRRIDRHETFRQSGVPAAYRDASAALYAEHCAACHDPSGTGHGEAGLALYPSPALLAQLVRTPAGIDEYLLWAISEGGGAFGSRMPAFEDRLTRTQIWQIITWMRAGFPSGAETSQD